MSASQPSPGETSGAFPAADSRLIGRYEIFGEIAMGGMAEIFLARQMGPEGFQRPVVIKRVLGNLARDEAFIEMFLDEARLAAQIAHPNVCQIFELGRSGDTYFMALEYLFGETLSKASHALNKRQRRLDPGIAAYVIANAAAGLHYAHEMRGSDGSPLDVVHRDVSPQNLFLTYDGHVKVLDFGIAKAAGRIAVTQNGQVKGKFAYMSPEQARGEVVDRRTDVWSLGIVLYEITTMTRLYRGASDVEVLYRLLEGKPARPSTIVEGYPPELEEIVMKAIEKDPANRFATARDLKRALEAFIAKTGRATGSDELADLMRELFCEERARKEQLLDELGSGGPPMTVPFERATDASLERSKRTPPKYPRDAETQAAPASSATDVPIVVEEPAARRRGARGAVIGIVLVAAALGVGAAVLSTGSTPRPAAPPPSRAALPSDRAPTPPVVSGTAVDPGPALAPSAHASCTVVSSPAGATVWSGSQQLCASTPCAVDACDGPLELRRDGYVTVLARAVDGRISATLEPNRPRPRVAGGRGGGRPAGGGEVATTTTGGTTAAQPPPPAEPPHPTTTTPVTTPRGPRPQDLPPL